MSEVRYYTDENAAKAVAHGLRQRGVDVLTAQEAGRLSTSDEEQLAFALTESRVVFTQDDDFLRLASQGVAHAGNVYAPQQTKIGPLIRGLMLIYHVLSAEEMIGKIEFI